MQDAVEPRPLGRNCVVQKISPRGTTEAYGGFAIETILLTGTLIDEQARRHLPKEILVQSQIGRLLKYNALALKSVFLLLLLLFAGRSLAADLQGETISVGSHSTVRSATFRLYPGDNLSVTADSKDTHFAVDLYVYDTSRVLAGKDNEESISPVFSWTASVEGEYYVLARNLGSGTGSITLAVKQAKAQAPTAIPTYAIRRVFFATDRNLTGKSAVSEKFGTEPDPSERLHLGECLISIPRDHRMGELEGPSIVKLEFSSDPEKHVTLLSVDDEGQPLFFRRVADSVSHSQRKELFVFVHGFNTTFEDAARRTAQIAYDLAFDGPAIVYSWPSQGRISLVAYNMDGTNAELTVPRLEKFLQDLVRQSGATTIHLIAHSMGNRPLTIALRQMAIRGAAKTIPRFNQVVLMAPDINVSVFKQLAPEIRQSSERITLYASSRDEALRVSSDFAGYPRAGQGGSAIVVVPGVDSIDASAVDTSALGLFHQYYADNSTVLSDLFHVLKDEPPKDRFGLKREVGSAGVYWVFRATQ